jgi:D-alanyl-D-alanine endopeptidase (penicillin-binding protein 7)
MLVAGGVFALLMLPGATRAAAQSTSTSKPTVPAAKKATTVAPKAAPKPALPRTTTRTAAARLLAAERARAAQAREQADAMAAHFKRDLLGNLVPDVRAAAAIIYNPETGEVVWEVNAHDQRSIASLTKVMTAVVFVSDNPDLSQVVTVTRADLQNASVTYLKVGDRLSYDSLLHLALIASDNAAARVLARTSEGGTAAFVARMNDMAGELHLADTHYTDPSGLDSNNVSSAYDLSHLISVASAKEQLAPIMRTAEYDVQTSAREFGIHSTNRLLSTDIHDDVLAGKTGFISKAGYCLATLLRVPQGNRIAVVVLGATNSAIRFGEARNLFNWVVGRAEGLIGG